MSKRGERVARILALAIVLTIFSYYGKWVSGIGISDPISLDIVMTKWMMVTKEVGHGHEATEEHDSAQ